MNNLAVIFVNLKFNNSSINKKININKKNLNNQFFIFLNFLKNINFFF